MADNPLQGTVLFHLPNNVDLRSIKAHAGLRCGLDKAWGETYLLVANDGLVVLTRASVFDEYDQVQLAPGVEPRLEVNPSQSYLYLQDLAGTTHRLVVTQAERPALERLLHVLKNLTGR